MKVEDWRDEIDAVDDQLLRLLSRRAQLAVEVGAVKRSIGLPLCDPRREREVLTRLCRSNTGPLGDEAIIKIFRRIICESRRLETEVVKTSSSSSAHMSEVVP